MIRINLLPVRAERKKESLRQQVALFVLLALVVAGGIVAVHLSISGQIRDTEAQISRRKTEISLLQAKIGQVKQFKEMKRDLEEKIQVISQLVDQQKGPSRVFFELAQIIPKEVWIESLKDTGGGVIMQGVAIDNQTIARFMTQMEGSPWFRGVRLDETKQVARAGVNLKSFSIQASVVYPKGG